MSKHTLCLAAIAVLIVIVWLLYCKNKELRENCGGRRVVRATVHAPGTLGEYLSKTLDGSAKIDPNKEIKPITRTNIDPVRPPMTVGQLRAAMQKNGLDMSNFVPTFDPSDATGYSAWIQNASQTWFIGTAFVATKSIHLVGDKPLRAGIPVGDPSMIPLSQNQIQAFIDKFLNSDGAVAKNYKKGFFGSDAVPGIKDWVWLSFNGMPIDKIMAQPMY